MRALYWTLTIVAVVGLTFGQPLCCVLGACCGQVKAPESARKSVEARGPRGVEVPCCKRCAANLEHETESPREPQAPREKCECAKKHLHLTPAGDETVSLDADLVALPPARGAAAPKLSTAIVTARAGRSPPGIARALTLPLLL